MSDRTLDVLRIADVPDSAHGGMPKAMRGSGRPLEERGHRLSYWFADDLPVGGPARLRRFRVPLALPALVRAEEARRGRRFDVVELHEPLAGPWAARRRAGADLPPCVVFSHGLEERRLAGELAYRRRVGLPVGIKRRFSPLTVVAQARIAVRHADAVMCCSGPDRDHLLSEGVPSERLFLKPSGLDDAFLGLGKTPAWPRPAFLFLGSWLPRKGVAELAAAGSAVLRAHPGATLTLAGVGDAADAAVAAFDPAIRGRLQVVPTVRGDDALVRLYREHAALVLPSFFEGQPLVMLEAAAVGLALVTTAVCGMLDFVRDGVEGLLVEPGDAAGLTNAMNTLVQRPLLRQRLGVAAQARARGHGWPAVSDVVEAAYLRAAGAAEARAADQHAGASGSPDGSPGRRGSRSNRWTRSSRPTPRPKPRSTRAGATA